MKLTDLISLVGIMKGMASSYTVTPVNGRECHPSYRSVGRMLIFCPSAI